jgi:hypothetical protein
MKITKLFLLAAASIMFFTQIYAQDVTIENVSTNLRKFRGVEHVKGSGHSLFIVDDKSSKGMRLFNFYLWDYNFKEIAVKKVELEKKSILIDNASNDNSYLLVFYDSKKNNVRSLAYNSKGENIGDKTEDAIKTKFMAVEDLQPSFYPAGNDGFFGVIPDKEPKFGFHLHRYDNNLNTIWKKDYFPSKGMQIVMDAVSDDKKLILLKYSVDSKFSKKFDVDMTAFDSNTGEELWSFNLNLLDKTLYPTEIAITPQGNVAVAGMYFDGDKVKGPNSDGIFFAHVDAVGQKIALTTQGWSGELQKFLKDSKNSITVGKPKVVFEDIVFDENKNQFKVIGEIYTVGTLGKAMAMLNNDPNAETKITIEDLVVFSFAAEGDLVDFYSVNKARTHIYVPTSMAGGPKIANFLKQTGNLPYAFSSKDENGNVIAFFRDYVKQGEDGSLTNQKVAVGGRKIGVGMLNVSTSSASEENLKYIPFSKRAALKDEASDIEFDSKRSTIIISESQPGYVIISELSKKTGSLKIFKEQVNK